VAAKADEPPQVGWVDNTPEALQAWAQAWAERYGGRPVAVVVEQCRGAVVAQLSQYGHVVVCPVAPALLARYRQAFRSSGAKDDPGDARALLDLFFRHPEQCRPQRLDTVATLTLQYLTEDRRRLVEERGRAVQRLRARLQPYFPQVLAWFGELDTPLVAALLRRWPTLEAMQRARPDSVRRFLRAQGVHDGERVESLVAAVRAAVPATQDAALIEAGTPWVGHMVDLVEQLQAAIADYEERIEEVARAHPDYEIVRSFPGMGAALAPRLIAALGTDRERFRRASELQSWAGIAPVVIESGRKRQVRARWACPQFVRQTFHEWAAHSIPHCGWAGRYYREQLGRGAAPQAAIRALAYKWMRILFRCWQERKPYSDAYYEQRLAARRSRAAAPAAPPAAPVEKTVQSLWKKEGGFYRPSSISA